MTCRELRLSFEKELDIDEVLRSESEHLAECAECGRFFEARRELGTGLKLLRESIAQPSAALDVAVLANYRHQIEGRRSGQTPSSSPLRLLAVWGVMAAMLLVATLFVLQHRRSSDVSATVPPPKEALLPSVAPTNGASAGDLHEAIRRDSSRNQRRGHLPAVASDEMPAVATDAALPEFRSLMYCDELSCGGPMQVIRVRLPIPVTPFATNAAASGRTVYADVLVGPDGIARGIRVDE
jgi:hypothetical protein